MSCKNIILLLLISEKTSMKYWIDESLEICRFAWFLVNNANFKFEKDNFLHNASDDRTVDLDMHLNSSTEDTDAKFVCTDVTFFHSIY